MYRAEKVIPTNQRRQFVQTREGNTYESEYTIFCLVSLL